MTACSPASSAAGKAALRVGVSLWEYAAPSYARVRHLWGSGEKAVGVSTGGECRTVPVVGENVYAATCLVEVAGPLSAVQVFGRYPADAAATWKDGKISCVIPTLQDGTLLPLAAGVTRPGAVASGTGSLVLNPLYRVVPVSLQRLPQAVRALTLRPGGEKTCAGACIYDPAEETVLAAESTVRVLLDPPQTGGIIPVMVADTDYPDGFSVTVETVSGETVEIPELASFEELVNTPYTLGTSLAINSSQTLAQLKRIKDAGIEWVEVTCNSFQRNIPEAEWETRAENIRKLISQLGLKVWSCHLPYSKTLDISLPDEEQRAESIAIQKRMIRLCGEKFHPQRLILHPSSEPIGDADRAGRLANARASIGELLPVAREIGAVLCIEKLPRTCLGRVTSEMLYLLEPYPDLRVCFDTNHLLLETHEQYFRDLGDRIGTVHVSDYDRVDERHALPGDGVIDWPAFHYMLRSSGYDGIFMFEVKSAAGTPAQLTERYNNVIFAK